MYSSLLILRWDYVELWFPEKDRLPEQLTLIWEKNVPAAHSQLTAYLWFAKDK